MEILQLPRGSGKTKHLIEYSAKYNVPIVTPFNKDCIIQMANEMGLKIPEPIYFPHFMKNKHTSCYDKLYWEHDEILVDDLPILLTQVFSGLNIAVATMTPDNIINKNEDKYMDTYNFTIPNNNTLYDLYEKTNSHVTTSKYIESFKVVVPNKVIIVSFKDGKNEKVVCDKNDTFDLRRGLFIAIAKHLYKHTHTLEGIEHKATELSYEKTYVKIVESAIKKHDREEKEKAKVLALENERKLVEKRKKEKKMLKIKERAKKNNEEAIELIAEAVKRSRES